MPRGRPRKIALEEGYTSLEITVGEFLAGHCGVPGCKPEWHVDEARTLLNLLESKGFKRERLKTA